MRQRQRHRQWLAAMMALSFPARSNSYSCSVTPRPSLRPSSLKQVVPSCVMESTSTSSAAAAASPHMFLSVPGRAGCSYVFTTNAKAESSRFGGRARGSSVTFTNDPQHDNPSTTVSAAAAAGHLQHAPFPCLGFDTRLHASSAASAAAASAGGSSLDSSKWNDVHEMDLSTLTTAAGSSSSSSSRIKTQVAESLLNKSASASSSASSSALAWLPWAPSRQQIWSLKLLELKRACAERGLKKSGLKAELQQRLWEWSQTTRQMGGSTAIDMGLGLGEVYATTSASPTATTTTTSSSSATRSKPTFTARSRPPPLSPKVVQDGAPSTVSSSRKGFNDKKFTKQRKAQPQVDDEDDNDENDDKTCANHDASLKANSLAEWSRDGVDHLLTRREAIHREKRKGKRSNTRRHKHQPKQSPSDYRSYLTKAFEASSSSTFNNRQVKQLYAAAKAADQAGDREAYRQLLEKLRVLTPNDGRIWRRLARMASEEGRADDARAILQEATRVLPDNAFLWHGLAQVEAAFSPSKQRACLERAIACDPSLPHPYHSLGTMEHLHGRIAVAMKVLKRGIQYCPTNHRLHHALGDIYREAKMLDMAEKSYLRALEHGPKVSHCFAYTALAFVSYDRGEIEDCRYWLRKSVSLNRGRHSQGWVALAQFEEAEGNIDGARAVCIGAISQYERGLLKRHGKLQLEGDPMAMKETLFRETVPQYRSGDKFVNVFRNWARLEQTHGHPESVDEVYTRATIAFPYDWKLSVNWAQYHASEGHQDRARELFAEGCKRAKNRHADPYRLYAKYEMSFGNYEEARKILFRGAQVMSRSSDGGLGENSCGLVELYHTWAVCEWHLGDLSRSEVLFDNALRLIQVGEEGAKLRSFVLYSIARLQYYRGEHELAQHFIGLCLKENAMPGGMSKVWNLWADLASTIGNVALANQCEKQVATLKKEERESGLFEKLGQISASDGLSKIVGASSQSLMRRDPWHDKIFGRKKRQSSGFFNTVELPSRTDEPVNADEQSYAFSYLTE